MSNDASGTSATGCSRAGVTPPSGAELSSHALTYAYGGTAHFPAGWISKCRWNGVPCASPESPRKPITSPACTCAPVLATGA